MGDTSDEKERLTNTEFAELIPHLPLQDLLLIEFKIDDWKLLIDTKDSAKKIYGCAICGVVQSGIKNLYAHIDGKKHKLRMQSVKQFYHPEYTYGRNKPKMAMGKINENSEIINTFPCKKNANLNRKNLQMIPLARNISNAPIGSGGSTVEFQHSASQVSNYNKNQSTSKVSEHEVLSNKPVIIKCDLTNAKNNASQLSKLIETKAESITSVSLSDNDLLNISNAKSNHSDELSKMVKNPFAVLSNVEDKDSKLHEKTVEKSYTFTTDVIIIEDEGEENTSGTKKKNLKRESSQGRHQTSAKKQKMPLNSATAFQDAITKNKLANSIENKSETDNTEVPRYQSDIVIVPTIDKNNKVFNCQMKPQPKFATKTFNCKLSDDDVLGLIGVEYVIKILKDRNDVYPKYECGLCEIVLDGAGMQEHLIGYNHRLKFCEKHFPTAIRQCRQYMGKLPEHEIYKVMAPILEQLAIAIEQYHGRDLPYECFERDMNINRHEILSTVFSCRHASDQYGPAFTHVVDSKEVDRLIESRHNYKRLEVSNEIVFNASSASNLVKNDTRQYNNDPPNHRMYDLDQSRKSYYQFPDINYAPVDDETHKIMVDDFLRGNKRKRSNVDRCAEHYNNYASRSRSATRKFERSRSQTRFIHRYEENDRKSLSPLRDNDVWQAYRHMVDQKVDDLNKVFGVYRDDPERHPLYNEEWEMFWKRRKEEIMAAGLDHRTYNYQPEWVRYFNARIEELYNQSLENIKIESRERLCLPMANNYLTDPKYHVHVKENTTSENDSVIIEAEKKPEIVSVLRIMTALEEHLGSLGPKIIELLSKALQTEKTHPTDVNKMVLTPESCTLLETAMEKFKGLVIAGLLDRAKERALRKAIEGVELLLANHKSENKNVKSFNSSKTFDINIEATGSRNTLQQHSESVPIKRKSSEVKETTLSQNKAINSLLGQGVKKELAAKLAAVLNAQGKTDIDPHQLQQILAVYMLIEKKKQEATSISDSGSELLSTPTQKALTETLVDLMNSSNDMRRASNRNRSDCIENKSTMSIYSNDVESYRKNSKSDFDCPKKNIERNAKLTNMMFRSSEQPSYDMQQNFKNSNETLTETLVDFINSSNNVQGAPSNKIRSDRTENRSTMSIYSNNVESYRKNMQQNFKNSNETFLNRSDYNTNRLDFNHSENFPANVSGNYMNNISSNSSGINDTAMNTASMSQLRASSYIPNVQRLFDVLYGRECNTFTYNNTCPDNQQSNWTSNLGRDANKWP